MKDMRRLYMNTVQSHLLSGLFSFRLVFLAALSCLSGWNSLDAQSVGAVRGRYGSFIYCGHELPKLKPYVVSENNDKVASLSFPYDAESFLVRVHEFCKYNPYIQEKPDSVLINYWQWADGFRYTDSLPVEAKTAEVLYGLGVLCFVPLNRSDDPLKTFNVSGLLTQTGLKEVMAQKSSVPKFRMLKHVCTDNSIILDWQAWASVNLLEISLLKQHIGQDELQECKAQIFVNRFRDSMLMRVVDTMVFKGLMYRYQLTGVDQFGFEYRLSEPVSVTYVPLNSLPVILHASAKSKDEAKAIELRWQLQNQFAVQSIDIYRSDSFDSGYDFLASVNAGDSVYQDDRVLAAKAYWYKIVINGVFERGLNTVRIGGMLKTDAVPPPVQVIQAINHGQTLTLRWLVNASEVRGYYVFRKQQEDKEWVQVSPLIRLSDTAGFGEYTDSSDLLPIGEVVRYCIRTLSKGYVLSDYGVVAEAEGRSLGEMPLITEFSAMQDQKKVLLRWTFSQENYQLAGFVIERKDFKVKEWKRISSQSAQVNYFEDTSILQGVQYDYRLIPVDLNGRERLPHVISLVTDAPLVYAPEITHVSCVQGVVRLTWEQNAQEGVEGLVVYRIEAGKEALRLEELKPEAQLYEDKTAVKGKVYYYYLTVKAYGKESVGGLPNQIIVE